MRLLLALASVAVMIGIAAPAYADDDGGGGGGVNNDQDFLAELRQAGINYQDPAAAISAAKSVCQAVDDGSSDAEIVTELRNRNPAFQGTGAAKFTTLAAAHYCPKYLTGEGRPPQPGGGG
jgi:hypothetical protein